MSKIIEEPIFTDNLQGGDTFVLEKTDKHVWTKAGDKTAPIIETSHYSYWKADEKLTKENRAIYKERMRDWKGQK